MIFLFHFLALLLFVVTQENRKVSMRSKLWWCEVQKSGIFGLFTGWIFFSLFSGWRICIPIESGFIQPDFFFFLFRHFLVIFGIFFYISSGSNGQAGGFWCVFGIAFLKVTLEIIWPKCGIGRSKIKLQDQKFENSSWEFEI